MLQTPLGAWSCLGIQLCYKASGDLRVEYVKVQWLTSGESDCRLDNGPKLVMGQSIAAKKWKEFAVFKKF